MHMRLIILIPLMLACAGCWGGTPPVVTALQVQQEETLAAYIKAETEAKLALCDELEASVMAQVEMILDYEVNLVEGDAIAKAALQELLTAYRQKREEVSRRMSAIREELKQADVTAAALMTITRKLGEYLAVQKDSLVELRRALQNLKGGEQ